MLLAPTVSSQVKPFLSCCTQDSAHATDKQKPNLNTCACLLSPQLPDQIWLPHVTVVKGFSHIIQAELWHKPPLGTATKGQGVCGPSLKAANMGRLRTLRFGESLPKCRNANIANLLGRERGRKDSNSQNDLKKNPLNQLLLFKPAGSFHTAEEPVQTDLKCFTR